MTQPSFEARHLVAGSISLFIAEALILPTGFITAVYLARQFGPADYGLFALVSRVSMWIEILCATLFTQTAIKFICASADQQRVGNAIARLYLLVGFGACIILWCSSSFLATVFNEPDLSDYFKLFSIEIPIFCLACANSDFLIGKGEFNKQAMIQSTRWLFRLLLIVLLVEMGFSIKGAVIGSIGATAAMLIISLFFHRPNLLAVNNYPMGRFINFSSPLIISNIFEHLFRLDLIALKILGGAAAHTGYYGAALNIAILPDLVNKSLAPTLLSTVNTLKKNGDHLTAKNTGAAAIRFTLCLTPFAAMCAGASDQIVTFIFGKEFITAGSMFAFLIFATLALLILNIAKSIIIAANQTKTVLYLSAPMVPLAFIGHLILTSQMNGLGAAIVTCGVAWLAAVASLLVINKLADIHITVKTILNILICSGSAYALAVLWPASGIILIVKLAMITIFILLAYFVLGEFDKNELAMLRLLSPLKKFNLCG